MSGDEFGPLAAEELLGASRRLLDAVAAAGGDAADVQAVSTSVRATQVFADGTHTGRDGVTTVTGLRVRAGGGVAGMLLGAPPGDPAPVARLAVELARRSRLAADPRDLPPLTTQASGTEPSASPAGHPHAVVAHAGAGPADAVIHPVPAEPDVPFEYCRELLSRLLTPVEGPVALGAEHVRSQSWTVVADTAGTAVAYEQAGHHAWHWLEGLGGHMVDGLAATRFGELSWDALAARAHEFRAVHLAGPRAVVESGPRPVLLHPEVAAHLVRSLGFLLSAGNVLAGMRPLLSRVGKRIAAPAVTLVDDPPAPVDAQATPTRRQTLLEAGVLRGFLTSRDNAAVLGVPPSGSARREAPDKPAVESPSRIRLTPGTRSVDALRSGMDDGIEAVGVVHPGAIRGGRGTFTTVVLGWKIRGGRRVHALGPVRISLGVFELLRSIEAVGDDPARSFLAAGAESPSVLVSRMDVG
ncbi:metallopeptidase TldD-related protein [Sphaerisporangium aureirubrum]|uniref:Metallopeptidase TldD-related protein n=1 Tax=Sphaerisporangium aureirubrum TaxID=1544736 RepID=A0ABW1NGM6_9ACTN